MVQIKCDKCNGQGFYYAKSDCPLFPNAEFKTYCLVCKGSGYINVFKKRVKRFNNV